MEWSDALDVVVSAVGVYVGFLVLVRVFGQRSLASLSSFDAAATIALGAVAGRAVLGYTPTLLAGLLGVMTLFASLAVVRALRRNHRFDRMLGNQPMLVMAHGQVLHDRLRRAGLHEDDLRQRLRSAGVRSYDEVAAVVVERTGAMSVIRQGGPIADEIVCDVRGRELLRPARL